MIIKSHVIIYNLFKYLAIKISPDGKYLATAQTSFPGFPADILVWDFETR
jgi:WD40 repeat protein